MITMKLQILLSFFIILSVFFSVSYSSSSMICYLPKVKPFIYDLKLQCPNVILSSSPIQMDGESLDRFLSSFNTNTYTAILFYASWCPFSRNAQTKFDALASMYPQIKHVKVEQSSALPTTFSIHGIHSVPMILIANRMDKVRYRGPKDLHSLLNFYQKTTGLERAMNITEQNQSDSSLGNSSKPLHAWNLTVLKDEPYLAFSLLFVLLKAFLLLCPNFVSNVITLWVTYIPRLNLAIFGESKQLLTHALHLFDVKAGLRKLKLSKIRNFHNGARSARVLASSLASVSLGETSSPRA